jgi:hypothetical protein
MDTVITGRERRLLRAGVWGVPVFTGLLALSTLTHQPDPDTDFAAYARYVTTPVFLVGHLGGSIVGAAIGIVGLASLGVLVAADGRRPGRTLLGAALSVLGNVLNTALYGVAAFEQPAAGRAFRAGTDGVEALHSDVYGPELYATAGLALLAWTAGAVLLGTGLRTVAHLRAPGIALVMSLIVFYVAGVPVGVFQPLSAAVATGAGVVLARRLATTERPRRDRTPVLAA